MSNEVEVAIVGGGLAGATLAAVLTRAAIRVTLFDPHETYRPDFRAEKLTAAQLAILARLGLDAPVRAQATDLDELWIARAGKVVERRRNHEVGLDYAALVNALRARVPAESRQMARVVRIEASREQQKVHLGSGEEVTARLVVLATGLGQALLGDLGVRRHEHTREASLAIGFDLECAASRVAPLTYYGETPGDRSAYLTVFPIGERIRANLFVYRTRDEAWSRAFRSEPDATLDALMPGLRKILGDYRIAGSPVLRPIHLYETTGCERDGIVLVGDAFATTCPTGGTGIGKVLTDVETLAALVPTWLATAGMGRDKIAAYYAHPAKQASDRAARTQTAYARDLALNASLAWVARRRFRYHAQQVRDRVRRLFKDPEGLSSLPR